MTVNAEFLTLVTFLPSSQVFRFWQCWLAVGEPIERIPFGSPAAHHKRRRAREFPRFDAEYRSSDSGARNPVRRERNYPRHLEDEWKVAPNLTINAGVRYNFFNALHALHDQAVPFDFATCGGFCPNTYSYFNPRYDDLDPRIGIAWSHRDTVLRVGAGIYHTDGQADDQNLPISNTVNRYSFNNVSFPGLSYPLDPFLAYSQNGGLGVVSPRALDRNRKDDYVSAWTVSLQQSLPLNFIATLN